MDAVGAAPFAVLPGLFPLRVIGSVIGVQGCARSKCRRSWRTPMKTSEKITTAIGQ
jgi:hypothetical protein